MKLFFAFCLCLVNVGAFFVSNQGPKVPITAKLFMQAAGRSSYGLSAGYLKARETGLSTQVAAAPVTIDKTTSITEAPTAPRSYGFSSSYIRQRNEQPRSSSSEIIPVVSSSSPAVIVSSSAPAVTTPVRASSAAQSEASTPVKRNYGPSSGYLKYKTESPAPARAAPVSAAPVVSTPSKSTAVKAEAVSVAPAVPETVTEAAVNEDDSSFLFLTNLKYEQQAKKTAALEVEQNSRIVETTETFRSSVSRSLAKKLEAENIIIEELTSLRPLISNEIQVFANRVRELQQVSGVLETSYRTKERQISQELELLSEMQQIRDRISERNILAEYDRALGKKKDLIQVDQELYRNLAQVIAQLSNDIFLCKKKQTVLTEKLSAFPALSDRAALLKYSWSDIAEIQSEFSTAETTKAWKAADEKVQGLVAMISSAESRRTTILEEVRTLETQAVNTPVQTAASISSTQQQPDTSSVRAASSAAAKSSSTALARLDSAVFQSLTLSGGLALVRIPSSEMRNLLESKSAKEVAFLAGNAVLVVLNALAALSSSVVDSAVSFTKSSEAAEAGKALDLSVNAASTLVKNVNVALGAAQESWNRGMSEGEMETTTDELLAKVIKATKNVLGNDEMKSELGAAVSNLKSGAAEATLATGIASSSLSNTLQSSDDFKMALDNLSSSVKFLSALTAATSLKAIVKK